MESIKITVTAATTNFIISFRGILHRSNEEGQLQLDRAFYDKEPDPFPANGRQHIEIELTEPKADALLRKKLNVHPSGDGRPFVCFPHQLSEINVMRIFQAWCVITAEKMHRGAESETTAILEVCGNDHKKMVVEYGKKGYTITAIHVVY